MTSQKLKDAFRSIREHHQEAVVFAVTRMSFELHHPRLSQVRDALLGSDGVGRCPLSLSRQRWAHVRIAKE